MGRKSGGCRSRESLMQECKSEGVNRTEMSTLHVTARFDDGRFCFADGVFS